MKNNNHTEKQAPAKFRTNEDNNNKSVDPDSIKQPTSIETGSGANRKAVDMVSQD